MTKFPYDSIDAHQFWKKQMHQPLIDPHQGMQARFQFNKETKIASAGSCFAQRISESLQDFGFQYYLAEPGPPWLDLEQKLNYNYGAYSARYGNIYTSLHLLQLIQRALGLFQSEEDYWEGPNCFYDPFRPRIQPNGFSSIEELKADRQSHLNAIKTMFEEMDILIFTMGLTEAWCHRGDQTTYPMCPGRGYGEFDDNKYYFKNLTINDNMEYMRTSLELLKSLNPNLKVLLTVSPVPLVATMEDRNVLQSTIYSKSVLRVVCEELKQTYDWIDYFASYEIITATFNHSNYYQSNRRNITPAGIEHVLTCFYGHFSTEEYATLTKVERDAPQTFETQPCDEDELMKYIEADFQQ